MELWIRSQDKCILEKVNDFHLLQTYENKYEIVNSYMTIMGRYKTKERALEVLDDIQRYMTMDCSASGDYETLDIKLKELYLQHCIIIYNMPKD